VRNFKSAKQKKKNNRAKEKPRFSIETQIPGVQFVEQQLRDFVSFFSLSFFSSPKSLLLVRPLVQRKNRRPNKNNTQKKLKIQVGQV
jgi:hypothetical protein